MEMWADSEEEILVEEKIGGREGLIRGKNNVG